MAQRGGKRLNAGRKPGSANVRSRAIADKAAAEGITPLEVMLKAMRVHIERKNLDAAAAIAKDAAPYMHPRLSQIEAQVTGEHVIHTISDKPLSPEEWAEEFSQERRVN